MVSRPQIVGILNITPDSFSDGGLAGDVQAVLAAMRKLIADGADVVDIGAESTRPGAGPLHPGEEWDRLAEVLPQICRLAENAGIFTSIDTRHAETAQKAIACGINWVNDVSGGEDEGMREVLSNWHGKVVIMHNLGVPADKNITIAADKSAVTAVHNWFTRRLKLLEDSGILRDRIIIDPGIGFGKAAGQSWELINNIAGFKTFGTEIMVGHSRKSFLGSGSAAENDTKTLEISIQLAAQGVNYLRVHDVALHRNHF